LRKVSRIPFAVLKESVRLRLSQACIPAAGFLSSEKVSADENSTETFILFFID
jgi:hypothetical protein